MEQFYPELADALRAAARRRRPAAPSPWSAIRGPTATASAPRSRWHASSRRARAPRPCASIPTRSRAGWRISRRGTASSCTDEALAACREDAVAVFVDCADHARAGERLQGAVSAPVGSIDHHLSNGGFAAINIVDRPRRPPPARSWPGSSRRGARRRRRLTAMALYAGILTDTGQFRFNSTSRRSFILAGRAGRRGADRRGGRLRALRARVRGEAAAARELPRSLDDGVRRARLHRDAACRDLRGHGHDRGGHRGRWSTSPGASTASTSAS